MLGELRALTFVNADTYKNILGAPQLNIRILLAVAISSIFSFCSEVAGASADEFVLACRECTQDSASTLAARGALLDKDGFVYIADFNSELIWRFHIKAIVQDGTAKLESFPAEVSPQANEIFSDWLEIKRIKEFTTVNVPIDMGVSSAFDLVGFGKNQGKIEKYLFDEKAAILDFPEHIISDSFSFIAAAASDFYTATSNIEIKTVFADGSSARFKMTFPKRVSGPTVGFNYIDDSPIDSDGNRIPDSSDISDLRYGELIISDVKGSNFIRWKERLAKLGFTMEGNWDSYGSSSCTYSCLANNVCSFECSGLE